MKINGKPDGGGGGGVITGLSVSANGIYIATGGVDGYNPVEVDVPEQKPEESFNVSPSTTEQTITPQEGYVFSTGTVAAVTSTIDGNIQAGNIKSGVTILGVEGNYTAPAPVTSELSVSVNNTYYPAQGVDGFSKVIVDVPQSVAGFTEKEITEETYAIYNLNNSASFVHRNVFEDDDNLQTVYLPNASYVGSEAFKFCDGLTSVDLPICKLIFESAFMSCRNLTYVSVPELTETVSNVFNWCINLSSIEMPKLTHLGDNTFETCYSLTTVSLPKCKFVGINAFRSCYSLQSIYLPECVMTGVSNNYGGAFYSCNSLSYVDLPKLSMVAANTFFKCSSLNTVSIPTCTIISSEAFKYCTSLSVLSLPVCFSIAMSVFYNCYNLESLYAPYLYVLSSNAFVMESNNNKMSVIDLPNCTFIGQSALYGLRSLKKINLPVLNRFNGPMIGNYLEEISYGNRIYMVPGYSNTFSSFTGSIYVDAAMYDQWAAHSQWGSLSALFVSFGDVNEHMLSYSDGVLTGKTWAVYSNYHSYVTVGLNSASITNVDLSQCRVLSTAFLNHTNLVSVNLPECEIIGNSTFRGCYSLTTVSIPKCKFIIGNAFYDTGNIDSITLPVSTVVVLTESTAFLGNGGSWPFYVPASLVDAYKADSVWSWYSSRIFPITE